VPGGYNKFTYTMLPPCWCSSGAGLAQDDLCLLILPVCDRITNTDGLFFAAV
jgi:hypothetical protein